MFVKLHNHSRIKSFLQSIYLKSSVHRLWIWQRIFPQSRFDFIPGNRYKNLAHSQQGSLFTLSFSFKTCDKYQIAHVHRKADGAAAHTALPPGVTRPPRCAPALLQSRVLGRVFLCSHPGLELENRQHRHMGTSPFTANTRHHALKR